MAIIANGAGEFVSSLLIAGHFLAPDDQTSQNLLDFEWGGIGLSDPSAGLRYQFWTLQYFSDTGDFVLSAPNTPATVVITLPDVTEVSLAFDQNMRPFFAYVQADVAKFYWWDTNIAAFTHTTLPADSLTPRCCLDDKRETQTNSSDIILCYVYNGDLKMRRQRDRYTIEYTVKSPFNHPVSGLPATLKRVGMNEFNRLQWLCSDPQMNGIC